MTLGQITYTVCSGAFVILIGLMLLRGKVSGITIAICGACGLTAVWAASVATEGWLPSAATGVLDSLRLSAWLLLTVAMVKVHNGQYGGQTSVMFLATAGFCAIVIGYEISALAFQQSVSDTSHHVHDFLRVGFGVGGLLAVENLSRNAGAVERRNLLPFCLAIGGMFAFELFLDAEHLMIGRSDPMLANGRGLVSLLAVPLLTLAIARNRDWRVDIHVSRAVVLHTATLVASGAFFLVLAAIGIFVRQMGGSWGPTLQLVTLIGSALVLVSIVGSNEIRIYLKQIIARHFFSHRFDYRAEWLRFVGTMSQPNRVDNGLAVRVVRALAQIVDSPAGSLWVRDGDHFFSARAGWNHKIEQTQKLPVDDDFVAGFRGGAWIQQKSDVKQNWPSQSYHDWLAIPLTHGTELIAFAVLAAPPHAFVLDRETFDLLGAAGRQAASYLAEENATRELLDARLLQEYSKRFAFVVHDLKNLAGQLGMVVSNARYHIEDPVFRQDMLLSVEESVAKMNRLLAQLRAEGIRTPPHLIEPDKIISNVVEELRASGTSVKTQLGAPASKVAVDQDHFRSMLVHLINNACEAAPADTAVVVTSCAMQGKVIVDVIDNGAGMDESFIQEELFRPFRSTKNSGFGIGAYQTRELLRMAGGELDVISKKGTGTIMRMSVPAQIQASIRPAADHQE